MGRIMDKFTPTYDIEEFKRSNFGIKQSALLGAAALGFELQDAIKIAKFNKIY